MKQMPVESFFAQVGMPSRLAIARTSRFVDLAERKQHRRQLRLREPVQEVALVLRRVDRLQQLDAPPRPPATHARVVTGRDPVGAERQRMVEERAET